MDIKCINEMDRVIFLQRLQFFQRQTIVMFMEIRELSLNLMLCFFEVSKQFIE